MLPSQPRASPRSSASACGPRGGRRPAAGAAAAFMMRPTTAPLTQHVVVVITPLARRAGSAARLRISWLMSVPVVPDYLESGDAAEHEKDRTQNKVIQNPGDACAEERHGGEQSKVAPLGVHSRSRLERGSD